MTDHKDLQAIVSDLYEELSLSILIQKISIEEANELYVICYEDGEGKYAYIDEEDLTHFIDTKTGRLYINTEEASLPYKADRFYLRLKSVNDLLYYTKFVKQIIKTF